ncbi:cation diffusion facilitator family transporter [Thiotrichales bacterium HSG14]|nr:cation diffusion facilitator family transporter [Thiotrichales bacterium HSG14]
MKISHFEKIDTLKSLSSQKRYIAIRNITWLAIATNILLTLIKIIFGFIGHSQALMADGLHSLSDLLVGAMTLIGAKYSTQPPDIGHPYGHGRIETLVTIAGGGLLLLMAAGLLIDAQRRLFSPELLLLPTAISLAAALLSIVIKETLYQYTMYVAKQVRSPMLRANAWHHRSDAISSVIVFIGIAGSMSGFIWWDAVATIGISFIIGYIGLSLSLPGIKELIDTGLEKEQLVEIKNIIKSVKGVHGLHQLRTRKMGINVLVDVHILVNSYISVSEAHKISETVRKRLMTHIEEIVEVLVHVDFYNDETIDPTLKLPFRHEIIARLQQYWQPLKATSAIEQITLHYLPNKLTVDIDLPLNIVRDIEDAQRLSQRFSELVINDPDIQAINVYYRSYPDKRVLKTRELLKLVGNKY